MPESHRHLSVQRDADVVTCSFSNPPRHTLTALGVRELRDLVTRLEADPSVRVLVLTGAGEGVFVAHYEVGELADAAEGASRPAPEPAGEAARAPERLHPLHRLTLELEAAHFVTVAAINGTTAGGGLELALGCDFRLAMEGGEYRLGLPETSVGIIPGAGGTQRLARLLGSARALDLILHARLVDPQEALALGLVHRTFPAVGFPEEVAAFAHDLASRAPLALAMAKRAVHEGLRRPLEEGLAVEQACFERTMRSKDAAGAMRAFLRGETWRWTGE